MVKLHRDRLSHAINKGTGEQLHRALRHLDNARLKDTLQCDAHLMHTIQSARRARRVQVVSAYKRLKCALGWHRTKGTVKVRAFRHAKSRQVVVGDQTPTGMLSEWTYNASDDTYRYPKGHESVGDLKGLDLGAVTCTGLKRMERAAPQLVLTPDYRKKKTKSSQKGSANNKLAFIGLDTKGTLKGTEVGTAQWFFEVDTSGMDPDTPPMYALKVRFFWGQHFGKMRVALAATPLSLFSLSPSLFSSHPPSLFSPIYTKQ